MNTATLPSLSPREVLRVLTQQRKLWAVPAIACGLLAAMYSLVMPRYWEASQALVVRQETAGSRNQTPGKFADLYEMRTMQETILELAKSQQVIVATLKAVDQKLLGAASEPTAEDIEKLRERLKMLPPHGGEFGKTEVFYFYVKDRNRLRAIELVGELCRQLDGGLKQLRAKRAGGLIAELEEQVALTARQHASETQRLVEFETQVGADLGELRMLHSASSGQSDLRQEAVQLQADLRKFETHVRDSEQLLALLRAAEKDTQKLVATPNTLLVSQPALRRLKDGLVDAQLATARLGGTRSADHPRVRAAVEAEQQIRRDLHRELVAAISGAEIELSLGQERAASTRARLDNLDQRLSNLAKQRAEYSNRVAAVDNSRITLDRARQNLSTAKAAQAAAHTSSLVTRIDNPETGPYPAGPGRTVVAGAGAMGGLMLGLGLVFLNSGVRSVEQPAIPTAPTAYVPMPARQEASHETRSLNVPRDELSVPAEPAEAPAVVLHPMPMRHSAPVQRVERTAAITPAVDSPNTRHESPAEWQSTWQPEPTPWDLEQQQAAAQTKPVREPVLAAAAIKPATVTLQKPAPAPAAPTSPTSVNRPQESPKGVTAPVSAPAAKKPSAQISSGALPSAGGALPPSVAQGVGGLSLQEALEAARKAGF